MSSAAAWEAVWSGSYPCLCVGRWTLMRDGEPVSVEIPFAEESAGTLGEYAHWWFGEDYSEEWGSYADGLGCDEWVEKNSPWLSKVAEPCEWPAIYEAFRKSDFRSGSCGGCI